MNFLSEWNLFAVRDILYHKKEILSRQNPADFQKNRKIDKKHKMGERLCVQTQDIVQEKSRKFSEHLDVRLYLVYNIVTVRSHIYKGGFQMTIIPMRDLKDTVEIERKCAEANGPVFVTKNGYGRLVVMDIEYFERTMGKLFEAGILKEGLSALSDGEVADGDSVRKQMTEKYGL